MKVDVIILLVNGLPEKQFVIKNSITAEATFDDLCEKELGEDWEEFKNTLDYGFKYDKVRKYLNSMGKDIIWLNRIEVNKYKN